MVRLTIRATDDSVPHVLIKLMEDRIAAGQSLQPHPSEMSLREMKDTFGNVLVS